MAEKIYEIKLEKPCPRCGSKDVIVAVYHFGTTHLPRCKNCGLNNNKGDAKELVKPIILDCYYNYEEISNSA